MKRIDCHIKIYFFLAFITCQITLYANGPINTPHPTAPVAFTVSGKVVDGMGYGLPGTSVIQKGHSNGTTTAADGSFRITIQEESAILVISHIGFQSQEVSVKAGTPDITVQLSPGLNSLEDVIVVGYGTQKRQLSTSAVSTVKGEQLKAVPAANISNSLAGRATGIITRANGGRPGADNATIYVRGIATTGTVVNNVTYNTTPLIVVDGVIRNNINEVDPNNMESVTVLKDAAAVAPYGLGVPMVLFLLLQREAIPGRLP